MPSSVHGVVVPTSLQFLWLSVIAAITCAVVNGDSYRAVVTLYDDSSCSSPASVMTFLNQNCESPQPDHDAPTCQDNGNGYSVTDCDGYMIAGNDYYGLIQRAFDEKIPYLLVEEYFWMPSGCKVAWWWQDYGLGDVTAYRLDEDCHTNRDGSASTKLTLGTKLTITKYSDTTCTSVLSQTDVTWDMATQGQCVDNKKFYLRGAKPAMAAVAVFDDMACSKPTRITFTQQFGCSAKQDPAASVCGPSGPIQYSISSCTPDHSTLTDTLFGYNVPYVMVEKHANSYCGSLQSVTVFAADGLCHTNRDDGTSIRVVLSADGSGAITSYTDSYCSQMSDAIAVTKRMVLQYSCLQDTGCNSLDGSCTKRYSVGGFGGPSAKGEMTAVSVYESSTCSQPAATLKFTRELSCIPQAKSWAPVCEDTDGVHSISDCAVYTAGGKDSNGLVGQAFGLSPYVFVEEFDTSLGSCGDNNALVAATAYHMDNECHTSHDRTSSTRLIFGNSLTIVQYDDPGCTVLSSELEVTLATAMFGLCVGGNKKVQYYNSWPDLTAVAVFDDSGCSQAPTKLTFTQLFGCRVSEDPIKSVCGPDGLSHHSISSCTRDYKKLADTTFGSTTPYLIVEEFTDYSCGRLQKVTVYIADGACHSNTDDTSSFTATISKEGSASITTYLDSSCTIIDGSIQLSKRQLIASDTCYRSNDCSMDKGLCSSRVSFGGLGGPASNGQMTGVVMYGADASCSQPATMVTYTRELLCTPQSTYWITVCEESGMLHYTSYCTYYYSGGGYDSYGLLDRAFGWSNTYLLVEEYDTSLGSCGSDYALDNAAAYLLDEGCHASRDGATSTQLTLGHTVTISKYADAMCTTKSSQIELSWRQARRSQCIAGSQQASRFTFRGPTPQLTAIAVFDDSSCSGKPIKLTVTQDFVCRATQHPEQATCGADGAALYSVLSCTDDYSGLPNTVFGMNVPYVMVEEFNDYWCGQVEKVIVYAADGACHSNTDDATSFRATLTLDGSATVSTYIDSVCGEIDDDITLSRRKLASYACTQDNSECSNEDGYSCSKRISVGGLGGPRSMGRMTSIASYGSNSCLSPAATMEFTRDLVCTPQNDRYNPACQDNGTVSLVSDCTDYQRGGPLDWFLERYFGYSPTMYILVEEYDGSCGYDSNLDNATAYLLDEECHPSHQQTKSTRLTLGLSLTITEFDDPFCNVVSMTREVPFLAAKNYDCVDDRVIAYLRGGVPDLTAIAIYDDSACSETPVKLTFAQHFKCEGATAATCEQASGKHYSISSCTRDYFGVTSNAFGNENRFVMVQEFADNWCGQVQNVTVYAADGYCHSNIDGTSFRATIGSDNSATITAYTDASCKTIEANTKVGWEIAYYACVQNYECADANRYGCSRRFSVGGLGGPPSLGKMAGTVTYGDNSCSQPGVVSLSRDLVCKSKTDTDSSACEASGTVYSVSKCVDVSDSSNTYQFLDNIFEGRSHLTVEEYDTSLGKCGDQNALAAVTAFLLTEECQANSFDGGSTELSLGASLTIIKYNDAFCATRASETEVTWDMVRYGSCYVGNTRYFLRGPTPDLTAVTVFNDNECLNSPMKITLSQLFRCNADKSSESVCVSNGSGLYSFSSCVSDYTEFIANTFDNETLHLIEEKFTDTWCGQVNTVTAYVADGACHMNTDDATSFTARIAITGRVTIASYGDANCGVLGASINVYVGNQTDTTTSTSCQSSGSVCVNADGSECSKKFSIGGMGGSQSLSSKAITVYGDSSCAEDPVQLVVINQLACSAPKASSCNKVTKGKNTMYQHYTCIDKAAAFATSTFGSIPYLLVEKFVNGTNCETQEGAVAYKADGACYKSGEDGTSFRVVPNVGGSVTIATYPSSSCKDSDADYTTIGAKYLFLVNGEASFSAVTFYTDNTCSGVPIHLTFWPDAGCQGSTVPTCEAAGNSLFTVSSCTTDFDAFTAAAFGDDNPYMINRYYAQTGCTTVGYVYVYSADGHCHATPDSSSGFNSFRARIDAAGAIGFCSDWECYLTLPLCSRESCGSPPYGRCGSGMSVGGPSGPPPQGELTTVALYNDSTCSAPAVSVTLTSEASCTPQSDHYDPVCTSDGAAYSASDCTKYNAGGWDDIGIINHAFGDYPQLVVEKYVWCGMVDTVTDVSVYRLDENCYSNAAGNASHKLTLGYSLKITTYSDPNCVEIATETTVKRSTILSGWCGDQDSKYLLPNLKPSFKVVTVYEDRTCSGTPSQILFTPSIWCDPAGTTNPPCQAIGNSLFSVSSCTDDYSGFATAAFDAGKVFVIQEDFSREYCDSVGLVTVYTADGTCHTDLDGSTSFIATVDIDSTLALRTFSDPACNDGWNTAVVTMGQLISPMCMYESCYTMTRLCSLEECWWWACSRKLYLGGLGGPPAMGKRTIVTLYEDNSCTSPAISVTLTSKLTCIPQSDHYAPVCTSNGTTYSVSDCTQYYLGGWDDIGLISDAFGQYPHMIEEQYMSGRCGDGNAIVNVTMYRLDENCYPKTNGIGSYRLLIGRSVTITTYLKEDCVDVDTTTTVEQSIFGSLNCVVNDKRYYVVNSPVAFASLAVFEDNTCSGTPSLITFSSTFVCKVSTDSANAPCQSIGNGLFAISNCTSDYMEFTTGTFGGDKPFMIDRYYTAGDCSSNVGYVYAYSADGYCHTNSDDSSSFRARIDAGGWLYYVFFRDAACTDQFTGGGVNRYWNPDPGYCMNWDCGLMSALCSRQSCSGSCSRKISVGGPSGPPPLLKQTSVAVYETNSCSSPAVSVEITSNLTCSPQDDRNNPVCSNDGETYSVSDCTQYHAGGWDDVSVITAASGDFPYLIVEKYVWCSMMDTIADVFAYRLDENCYSNAAGTTSHKLRLGRSITITTYTDKNCMEVATKTIVKQSTIASSECGADDKKYLLGNARSVFSAVAIYENNLCSGTPSQIAFTPVFGCHDSPNFDDAPCQAIDNSLYSVAGCTTDYTDLAGTAFGVNNPFVIEQAFSDNDCNRVGLVTTYSPDSFCHTKSSGSSSFKVTIGTDGTLSFKTFYDPACKIAQYAVILSREELMSATCSYDNCDAMAPLCSSVPCYWWRCSRKLSIGRLDAGSNVFKTAVTVFNDKSCAADPVQIVITKPVLCPSPEVPTCTEVAMTENSMYQSRECITDVAAFANSRFSSIPYVVMERYRDGTDCGTIKRTVVYKADGNCYYSFVDGTSFRIVPSFGNSITFIVYPTRSCNDSDAEGMVIGGKYINTGDCYDGNMVFYGDISGMSVPTVPSTPTPTQTTATPSVGIDQKTREEIMFPAWLWEPTKGRVFESD
ncbi:hypothetical protein PHYPSEUDO_002752 [Phytophthora pseudosyringae]|uniref:Membrane-associated protein n=1 Tax=Phytophthora pseudosyringae TaxID=221518 RepID=A0A8T1VSL7_9STRA|nr:hypothetical protein PHYPSEUDO_002752 [Phytophthora pseudosyringae]